MWLNMDRPNNLMVIDAVMWFDTPIDRDRLRAVLQRRLVDRYPVFSERPVPASTPFGTPHWERDTDFDLDRHLRSATLPPPGDEAGLQRYVESRMSVPFDREHPLWEMTLVEGYGGGCAVVSRFHHSLADGVALSNVMLSLTDAAPMTDLEELTADEPADRRQGGVLGAAGALAGTTAHVVQEGLHIMSRLPQLASPARLVDALELATQTGQIGGKLLLGVNPPTLISGEPGVSKRAVWSRAHQLGDVKRVSRLAGATVNDVLVAAVSGAVSRYLRGRGADPVDLTTMIPVNIRRADQPLPRELGNKFALVLLKLPIGVAGARPRIAESKRRMDAIKSSPEAVITFGLNNLIGRSEGHLGTFLVNFFSAKAIGITTNVIGPGQPRYLAGSPIAGIVGWVPCSGQQTLGICIFSFAQTVRVAFKTDATILPDAEKLVLAFDQEIDEMVRTAHAN
jgi:diacylglycerol O-acyltransferase / wax synthase